MSTPETASGGTFAGRVPETFFKAQKRNRRSTWMMSALSVFAAFIAGIPLTLVLTPLLYVVTLFVADVINAFSPLPPEFWQNTSDLAKFGVRVADYVINQKGTLEVPELAIGLALILLPGMALAFLLWVGILLLFRRGGVGGMLASLNAREPNQADLKELQLADVVQEMAIAAGLPAPRVMLIDSEGANAAAIGTSAQDARIVLSRRLLDDLDRDQMQALLASLIASIGNGDLRIAFDVTSVFETSGLIVTLINAPFGRQSRRILWRIIRYAFRRAPEAERSADADEVAELLAETLDMNSTDIDRFFSSDNPGFIKKVFRMLLLPVMFTNMAVEITLWFFLNALLGPCMALVWRTRRYLADAGAVELTRNPDALASALQRLSEDTTAIEGGEWASHLFIVNPKGDSSLRGSRLPDEQKRKAVEAWKATEHLSGAVPAQATATQAEAGKDEYLQMRKHMVATAVAAATGNAQAVVRMQAFAEKIGADPALGMHGMSTPNDILLAQKGDPAAMARIRSLHRAGQQEGQKQRQGKTGLQNNSFLSFHPPLNKRAKRLQKMGSHLIAPTRTGGSLVLKIVFTLLYLIVIPAFVFLGAGMLLVIGMIIGLNLLVLSIWLSVIHWAFGQDWVANFNAFVNFVNDLIAFVRHVIATANKQAR